jgi:para-aminobenzoate synthetase/4-amino-4-deoxychorismate lyase
LLRNDLGRIAKTGSVKVDKLFEIEAHPTVFQMTSEISAELEDGKTLFDIFNAIYPCGSITGAPKHSTMRIISETEPLSREVYCGAIGYIHNDEAVFSVPIRILQRIKKHSSKSDEPAHFHYHAGGAIVWDSNSEEEWEETLTKTAFLKTDFVLIETAIDNWDAHFNRMKTSAKKLGFSWNEKIETLKIQEGKVLRVVLHKDGSFEVEYKDLPAKIINPKIKVGRKTNSNNPFLYHKTSIRCSAPQDCFDEIAINEKGEVTEGTFTNIGILKGGKYYTPPVSCGLLAGTKRAQLGWEEKILFLKDLQDADKIFCFNSVRGVVEVELC